MDGDYTRFIELLYKKTGIDLSKYKEKQMKRRLASLMMKRGCSSFVEYFNFIQNQKEYFNELIDRITINVSEFYRNYKRWEVLETKILPKLSTKKGKLNIWSAACSTGEEPYTIAMCLHEHIPLNQINIVATDIDENALATAKNGVYGESALKEVPNAIKMKNFDEKAGYYYVKDHFKKCITFEKHNLLKDPYKNNVDLIVCRNVLIYFTEDAKSYVYENFSRSLENSGVLFVGSTEQIFNPNQYQLHPIETFFYQKQS
ncbi:CheR family methyltransferase [Salirhabdus sp. Marseille-P4669]|uniref:CheR family methyltransferase n=1 Tax=Salirhabdus sp. Marseille-P4669 TaxID=2042310 RepID=UPI000C7BB7A8|nr:protein-glutamate O-methyltransferase CheR [Salirhabdus sp. Marseille-P4669]